MAIAKNKITISLLKNPSFFSRLNRSKDLLKINTNIDIKIKNPNAPNSTIVPANVSCILGIVIS